MAPDPAPPLPLAANRAALSNRISLLLASQSTVLRTMNLGKPAAAATTKRRASPAENDDDNDLVRGSRPNEGVGYVPDKKDAQRVGSAREERMLRGGKRPGARGVVRGGRVEESESEDDVGRSALGKRKRPRREVEVEQETTEKAEEKTVEIDNHVDDDIKVGDEAQQVTTPSGESVNKKRNKSNNKKNKNKNKKQDAKEAEEK